MDIEEEYEKAAMFLFVYPRIPIFRHTNAGKLTNAGWVSQRGGAAGGREEEEGYADSN